MSDATTNVLPLLLRHGGADVLTAFFAALCPKTTACLSRVCKNWAEAGELCMKIACAKNRWALPRRARLQRATLASCPWRNLFVQRACRACLSENGDFAVRADSGGAPSFFLCGSCAKLDRVVTKLQSTNATLDVTGLSGKPLYTRRQSSFCSDVSRLSKVSIDNANGSRAELLRAAGRSGGGAGGAGGR